MSDSTQVLDQFHKKIGEHIGGLGHFTHDCERLPSGVFEFDVATNGGWPMSRLNILYGKESSGKSALCLKTTASFQARQQLKKKIERKRVAYIDMEATTDRKFAEMWGVKWDDLIHLVPEHGEMALDMTQAFLEASDVGLVIVDSLATVTAMAEKDLLKTADESERTGGPGLMGRRLVAKCHYAITQALQKEGRAATVIIINQPRTDIGKTYGDPDRLPGGTSQRFYASLLVRLWGKKVVDEKHHKTMPCRLEVQGRIIKWKVPICGEAFQYALALQPHKGLEVGDVDYFGAMREYLEAAGVLTKEGNGYALFGTQYPTLKAIKQALVETPGLYDKATAAAQAYVAAPSV